MITHWPFLHQTSSLSIHWPSIHALTLQHPQIKLALHQLNSSYFFSMCRHLNDYTVEKKVLQFIKSIAVLWVNILQHQRRVRDKGFQSNWKETSAANKTIIIFLCWGILVIMSLCNSLKPSLFHIFHSNKEVAVYSTKRDRAESLSLLLHYTQRKGHVGFIRFKLGWF